MTGPDIFLRKEMAMIVMLTIAAALSFIGTRGVTLERVMGMYGGGCP